MTKILQIYEEAKQKCKTSDRFFSLNVFSNAHLEQKDAGYFLYNLVLTAPRIASKNEQPRVNNELRPVYRQAPCRLHQQGIRKRRTKNTMMQRSKLTSRITHSPP
jgi:hypothetical protein